MCASYLLNQHHLQDGLEVGIVVVTDSTPGAAFEEIAFEQFGASASSTATGPAEAEPAPPKPFTFNPALDE